MAQETLRTALAMGADKGIHIVTESRTDQEIQPLAVAKIIAQLAAREKVDAVIVGKQAIDGDNCQTGAMIAGILGWSQCTMASKVEVQAGKVIINLFPIFHVYIFFIILIDSGSSN